MSALAPSLQAFFTDRLANQLPASPNTVAAYRDAWRLLLGYLQQRTGKQPSQLDLADLDAASISAFLDHLEGDRHNSVRTRNARLAAIRSFFKFASLRHPEHAAVIAQVLLVSLLLQLFGLAMPLFTRVLVDDVLPRSPWKPCYSQSSSSQSFNLLSNASMSSLQRDRTRG